MKIPHVSWRNGRPRFSPSASLRTQGHQGHDLKTADGAWMTEGQALDWSIAFTRKIEAERITKRKKVAAARKREKVQSVATKRMAAPIYKSYTLGQLLQDFLSKGLTGKAENTAALYKIIANCIADEALDIWAADVNVLSRSIFINVYEMILKKRGVHIARLCILVSSSAWNWALDREIVTTANPVYRIPMESPKPRVRVASVQEFLHLVKTADQLGLKDVADMMVWGVFTAQRAGDRLEMMTSNIVDNRLEITQQKTGAEVTVKLASEVVKRGLPSGVVRIIDSDKDTPETRYNRYNRRWNKLLDEAKKTMPSVAGLHDQDLRDTAITWMGRASCTEQEIMSVTGHRQQGRSRIFRHYMQVNAEISDTAISKLELWFEKEKSKLVQKDKSS